METKVKGLNSNQIKLIAIIAMTLDHLTWTIWSGTQHVWYVYVFHIIGRLTAPIMWFFIAEGCHYTHDRGKYIARLFVLAIISHFAYDFAFDIPFVPLSTGVFNQTSVIWSLAWAVVIVTLHESKRFSTPVEVLLTILISLLAFPSDWSSIAAMCPFYLYLHRENFKAQARDIVLWTALYAAVYFLFLDKPYGILQMFTFLTIPILSQYNGQRGEWKGMKWLFYAYYPAHLVAIGILRLLFHGNVSTIF